MRPFNCTTMSVYTPPRFCVYTFSVRYFGSFYWVRIHCFSTNTGASSTLPPQRVTSHTGSSSDIQNYAKTTTPLTLQTQPSQHPAPDLLRVLDWNCTSMSHSRLEELIPILHKREIHVACLQEVKWHPIQAPLEAIRVLQSPRVCRQ